MAVYKCKMCGGTLEFEAGQTVVTCEYCGLKQTVPGADNEKKVKLFDRANRLRLNAEFDKAFSVYENIVEDFPEEAEAYWGLLLCKYGIEYVDDPKTGDKIPTCHRSSFDSIFDDKDFDMVMEYADFISKAVYREQAKDIENVRKSIVEVSSKEQPYDIFICYKETDDKGNRTLDSLLAQEVYDALIEKGYRVFFSRITLEDHLGTEYEPYIFAALNSAKVMLSFGTSYDYYNATWVKNEWSRFLKLMENDKSRYLIPCFKGIDAYDMPREFSKLQAQDMGKIGAIQDLLRGIEKLINPKKVVNSEVVQIPIIDTMLEKAAAAINRGDFENAELSITAARGYDPDNFLAMIYKLMADNKICRMEDLAGIEESLENNKLFSDAIKKADPELKEKLYNIGLENKYLRAKAKMGMAKLEDAYITAAQEFKAIRDYKDAGVLSSQCFERAEACKNAKVRRKKHIITVISALVACGIIAVIAVTVVIPSVRYKNAIKKIDDGKFIEAYELLIDLNGYKDSAVRASEIRAKCNYEFSDIGNFVVFGSYEQDNNRDNGKEEIEWEVIAVEEDRALLISRYALSCKEYNSYNGNTTWETCTLRNWLNSTFINDAFSTEEQLMIQTTIVPADGNPIFKTDPGEATKDKIFILSITEAKQYLIDADEKRCKATEYATAIGAYVSDDYNTTRYWLRTPGKLQSYATTVLSSGLFDQVGSYVTSDCYGVRPALWISLDF